MLQQLLYQNNIVIIVFIDFSGKIFAEAVGSDSLQSQIITDIVEPLLHRADTDREKTVLRAQAPVKTPSLQVEIELHRDCKGPELSSLFFSDVQAVSATVLDNVCQAELISDI